MNPSGINSNVSWEGDEFKTV